MKTILKATIALSLLAMTAAVPSQAEARWVFLGERAVALDGDRDVIRARGEGAFSKIRLCVTRRAVRFYDLDVVFGNGGRQDLRIRRIIEPGECTRAIDIRGNRRFIRRIIMKYETVGRRGRQAVVEVYGRR